MSEISDAAKAIIVLGDVASVEASGKVNILGAAWTTTQILPSGLTPPTAVLIFIDVPARFHGETFSASITLLDDTSAPVNVPGQGLVRMGQVLQVQRPLVPLAVLPPETPARVQVLMNLPNGVPLDRGRLYMWQLEIDGQTNPEWQAWFAVLAPMTGPVQG